MSIFHHYSVMVIDLHSYSHENKEIEQFLTMQLHLCKYDSAGGENAAATTKR